MTVREAIIITIQKGFSQIIIQSDFQLLVNSINGKVRIPKDIVNLEKDIKCLLTVLVVVDYCNGDDTDVDILA